MMGEDFEYDLHLCTPKIRLKDIRWGEGQKLRVELEVIQSINATSEFIPGPYIDNPFTLKAMENLMKRVNEAIRDSYKEDILFSFSNEYIEDILGKNNASES